MIVGDLLKALSSNKCIITYTKVEGPDEGKDKEMLCTLNPDILPAHGGIKQDPNTSHLLVWSLDKDNWRSVRTDTIKDWKVVENE